MQIGHYLPRPLPERLQGLATLALDLRWNWHHGTDELWKTVAPDLWEATSNPWLILETVSDARLTELATDAKFLTQLEEQLDARDEHFNAPAWFPSSASSPLRGNVAYFSMEFALSEALPIYSGGLGVLAADHLKTACDLDVPVIGVGLLYQQGYFRQALDASGEQIEFYPYSDPTMLPAVPLRSDTGEWVTIAVELPGRALRLRAWRVEVGRRVLLLLDSNHLLNDPGDRGITSELYGGGTEMRLQQEIVLGIGGCRLLHTVGLDCPVFHLNEGHAAFAILERAREFMTRTNASFPVALRATRAGNLFTTHTPVAAGFDRFAPDLFAQYFREYAGSLAVDIEALLALGRKDESDAAEPFNMAYLAVHGCSATNGVSRLHGEVSRKIFEPLFPRWPNQEIPIGHITNGVHMPTWDSPAADDLWTRACGKSRWRGQLESMGDDLRQVEDEALWNFRSDARRRLVAVVSERLAHEVGRRGFESGDDATARPLMDPDILTIGFARRFAEYKRPNLLLHDAERLRNLLCHRDRPVQLVIAGKAHPRDSLGKQFIREWHDFLQRPDVRGRAVFIEDYDLTVALALTQGIDVWLNTPRRPWEASGTSGMKVLVNGGLNLSELDGWWAEAYAPEVGWALGDGREHDDVSAWDAAEADALYRLLETDVVPGFYQRDEHGLPRQWIERVRESMARLTPQFSSNRMLREYVEQYYLPLSDSVERRDLDAATRLEQWHTELARHWPDIRFGSVTAKTEKTGVRFEVQIYLRQLSPEAVAVELYADAMGDHAREIHALERGEDLGGGNGYLYSTTITEGRPVSDYTPRVVPAHADASIPLEANFVLWYR